MSTHPDNSRQHSPEQPLASPNFEFDAGHLALDFANAADWHASGRERDWLPGYEQVLEWALEAGTVTPGLATSLRHAAATDPARAALARDRAVDLGGAFFRLFSALADGLPAPAPELAGLNNALATALSHARIEQAPTGEFALAWPDSPEFDRPLWPVVWAAAELLTSGPVDRIRNCGGDPCEWLFLDTSRNRSRRWCDMSSCGNRAKARRFYARQKEAS